MRDGRTWALRALPVGLIILGQVLIAVALTADLLQLGGRSGLGMKQVVMLLAGAISLLAGLVLVTAATLAFRDRRA